MKLQIIGWKKLYYLKNKTLFRITEYFLVNKKQFQKNKKLAKYVSQYQVTCQNIDS